MKLSINSRHRRWSVIIAGLLFCGRLVFSAESPSPDFKLVCQRLQSINFVEADFSEEKSLHILTHPLLSHGTLIFSPSRGVYRIVNNPLHQQTLITRSAFIQQTERGPVERMDVKRQPAARAFVEVMLSFFSGDFDSWEKYFETTFSGDQSDWRIKFVPLPESPLRKGLQSFLLEGKEATLEGMTLVEKNKDMTRTIFSRQRSLMGQEGEEESLRRFPSDLKSP